MTGHPPYRPSFLIAAVVFTCMITLTGCDGNPPPVEVGPLPQVDLSVLDPRLSEPLSRQLAALRESPEQATPNGQAGMLLHAFRQFELAAAFYQRAQVLEPAAVRWPYYLGVVYASQGRYDEAVASFNSVLLMDPTNLPAEKRLARALLDQGQLQESLRAYDALLVFQPADPEIRAGIGKVHAALGNTEEAVAHLARAVEIVPNYGEAQYALALAYRDLGDEKKAAEHLRRYEEDKLGGPINADPLMAAVNNLNRGPVEYLKASIEAEKAGRIREAIEHNLQALRLDPNLHQAHVNLIVLYGLAGESDSARRHYQQALALNPNSVALHYNYGRLCYDEGNYGEARASFQRALDLNPEDAFANNNMGETNEQLGRRDDAIRYYRRAVANRPDYAHAHFNLGRTLMQRGQLADAVDEFQLSLREETFRTPTYLATLASAYVRLGRTADALETFQRARQMAQRYGQGALVEEVTDDLGRLAARHGP